MVRYADRKGKNERFAGRAAKSTGNGNMTRTGSGANQDMDVDLVGPEFETSL